MKNKTAAIVICAFDAAEFIPDLLFGLRNQTPVPGYDLDIRIGVDACPKTAAALEKAGQSYYMAEKNVGHAILRNALIYQAPADLFLYFDADDQPFKSYCAQNIAAWRPGLIVMPAKFNCDSKLTPKGPARVENGGAMTFGSDLVTAVGGFAPYRCAIDTDLMRRAEMAGFKIKELKTGLYYRRSHPKALTKAKGTGMGSDYRKKVWAEMTAARKAGRIYIKPELVNLKQVNL